MKFVSLTVILLVAVILSACGGSSSDPTPDNSVAASPSPALVPSPTGAESAGPTIEVTPVVSPSPTSDVKPSGKSDVPDMPADAGETEPVAVPDPITPTVPEPPVEPESSIPPEFESSMSNHFGFMPAFYDYAGAKTAGGAWDRPHFERFTWGWIEKSPGAFDFGETDHMVWQAQQQGFHLLANVQPRAQWDQEQCHPEALSLPEYRRASFDGADIPCDMDAYRNFVLGLVERYDGDGIGDMPGLTWPIKHWEIMNEPEFTSYFTGTPAEYFEIVRTTATAIKEADPEALVVQGGLAGMMPEVTEFWQAVFDLGGADYFDVMNMHSIGHGEHLNIPAFKQFLSSNGITGKPIWVTEVQFQQTFDTENLTAAEFADVLGRSYAFALANGVDKLFYVNLKLPQGAFNLPFDQRSALLGDQGEHLPMFDAHLTVSEILGGFGEGDEAEIIKQEIGNWFISQGQYKFTIGGEVVYVLWGSASLPPEITGPLQVTSISGAQTTVDAASLALTASPVFVRLQ